MKRSFLLFSMLAIVLVACSSNTKKGQDAITDVPKDAVQDTGNAEDDVKNDTKPTDIAVDSVKDVLEAKADNGPVLDPNRQPVTAVGSDPDKIPYSLHLTWKLSPYSTLAVQWQTKDQSTGTVCWFAKADEVKTNQDDTVSMPFTDGHVFKGHNHKFGLKDKDQTLHWVEITGLTPGTTYKYRCGDMKIDNNMITNVSLSPLYTYTTPKDGDEISFMVYGDSRGGYDVAGRMATYIAEHFQDVAFHVFTGDFDTVGMMNEWDKWFKAMQPITTRWPLIPVIGNHEELTENNYIGLFVLPDGAGKVNGMDEKEKAFSYDIGPVHIAVVDTNSKESVQALVGWLDDDLKATQKPWKVIAEHHPAYSSSHHGNTDYVDKYLVPVFEANNVDFVFNGHDHDYERTVPIRNGKKDDETGVVYITTGGFGAPLYGPDGDWFTAYKEKTYNFINCKVTKTQFTLTAYDEVGAKIDQYTKNK